MRYAVASLCFTLFGTRVDQFTTQTEFLAALLKFQSEVGSVGGVFLRFPNRWCRTLVVKINRWIV